MFGHVALTIAVVISTESTASNNTMDESKDRALER
jgi:hypothetical protein